MGVKLVLNGHEVEAHSAPATPLLWVLRDEFGLMGTRFGCGAGLCGACTVHVDGAPARACLLALERLAGRQVRTIEGLGGAHPLQRAWIARQVPQCGYCQSGQLMSAAALLAANRDPSDADITAAMNGNLCRCGTYNRIRAAIKDAAAEMRKGN
ncbi:MAG: (2Fe-2S)-binding protein [Pseudomonadota bacterium]|nr:(2Fe-2S)-binding protein [Pseudomonadota bacterium]